MNAEQIKRAIEGMDDADRAVLQTSAGDAWWAMEGDDYAHAAEELAVVLAAFAREQSASGEQKRVKWVCSRCKSDRVSSDATATWDEEGQEWVLAGLMDTDWCEYCDDETHVDEIAIDPAIEADRCGNCGCSPCACDDANEDDRCRVCGKIVPGCAGECGCDAA